MLKRGLAGNNIIVNFQWVAQQVYTISSWGQALMETIALSNNKIPAVVDNPLEGIIRHPWDTMPMICGSSPTPIQELF